MGPAQSATQIPMISANFQSNVFERRRKKLLATLRPNTDLIVIFNHSLKTRSHDTEYDYRGNSTFLYYSGFPEPESALILRKTGKTASYKDHSTLLVRPNDPVREHWEGRRFGVEQAKKIFKVEDSDLISNLEKRILEALAQTPAGVAARIYTNAFHDRDCEIFLMDILRKHRARARRTVMPVESIYDLDPLSNAQRAIKGPEELKIMRRAGRINVEAHLDVMKALKPGMFEYEIQAICESKYMERGCRAPAYGSIVASGSSATVLHYSENNQKMKTGDLLLIDAGCEYEGYASDITRTFPVNGRFSGPQKAVYELVLAAQAVCLLSQAAPMLAVQQDLMVAQLHSAR